MCGIVGILRFDSKNIQEFEIKNFTKSLHHRGPDGSGIYLGNKNNIGFGHTRTSIFDISNNGAQPMSFENKRYWITFNGSIYNFIEIRKELEELGYKFKSDTDTEIILGAYSKWGEQCQSKFNGDWAFAIWDNLKQNLFVSVDRFGTKPLYYLKNHKYFIFASELKAFMYLPESMIPDFDYSHFLWLGKDHGSINTFLKNVNLLSAGHQININQGTKIKKKWWRTIDNLIDVPKNYNDQVECFKELFINSCKIRMRSDVPISSGLSGGIDSSSIVNTINKIIENSDSIERYNEKQHKVFFCDFLGDLNSEKKYAQKVIEGKNIPINFIDINQENISPEDLIKVQYYNESIDVDSVQLSILYKKMREGGIRQSIDGLGADEALGGYWEDPIYAMKDEIWPWSEKGRFEDLASIKRDINNQNKKDLKSKIILRRFLGDKKYRFLVNLKDQKLFIQKKQDNYSLIEKSKLIYSEKDDISRLNHFNTHLYEQFHYYNIPAFSLKWDKIAMSHGVGTRAPFLDTKLITYIFSLPSKSKIGNGYTKRILRDAMKGLVPQMILDRKDKRGFTSPENWYEKYMHNYIIDNLNSNEFLNSNIFDGKRIRDDYFNKRILNNNPSKIVLRHVQIMQLINSFKKSSLRNN